MGRPSFPPISLPCFCKFQTASISAETKQEGRYCTHLCTSRAHPKRSAQHLPTQPAGLKEPGGKGHGRSSNWSVAPDDQTQHQQCHKSQPQAAQLSAMLWDLLLHGAQTQNGPTSSLCAFVDLQNSKGGKRSPHSHGDTTESCSVCIQPLQNHHYESSETYSKSRQLAAIRLHL